MCTPTSFVISQGARSASCTCRRRGCTPTSTATASWTTSSRTVGMLWTFRVGLCQSCCAQCKCCNLSSPACVTEVDHVHCVEPESNPSAVARGPLQTLLLAQPFHPGCSCRRLAGAHPERSMLGPDRITAPNSRRRPEGGRVGDGAPACARVLGDGAQRPPAAAAAVQRHRLPRQQCLRVRPRCA